jgi:hypothetical protein
MRQETAALRDFNPVYVGSGSFTSFPRCPRHVSLPRTTRSVSLTAVWLISVLGS